MSLWKRFMRWLTTGKSPDKWSHAEEIKRQHRLEADRIRAAGEMRKVDETTDRPIGHRLTNPLFGAAPQITDPYAPGGYVDQVTEAKRLEEIQRQFEKQSPPPQIIKMPEPVRQESTQEWVTEQLRKGGRPLAGRWGNDLTHMGDADRIQLSLRTQGSTYFATGYSMRYLNRLARRAERRDPTLTLDELMVIRSRGLV